MKKMLLLGAALMALSFVPANAAPGNGLQAVGGNTPGGYSGTYTSTGAATSILVVTPNSVKVSYVDADNVTVVVYSNGSADPAAQGPHAVAAIPAGEEVTLSVGPNSAGPVTGWVGSVIISETA